VYQISPPTVCPSCEARLVWNNDLLYCHNPNCGEQAFKGVEHFAKTLKIKGLGPAAIQKLGFRCPSDIYRASEQDILASLGSEKLAAKLYGEIVNSFDAPLELLLPAFGIPLIGKTATAKLSETVSHITNINADTCERAGLGPKATQNLLDWMESMLPFFMDELPLSWYFSDSSTPVASKGTVCISGRLKSFKSKADATTALNAAGYEVKSSLTKTVGFLVNESGVESAKTTQARESGIEIITNLFSFLEN
jgi:NAD-dependent DNA ligase